MGRSWLFLRIALLISLTLGTMVLPPRVLAVWALCGGMIVISLLSSSPWSFPGGLDRESVGNRGWLSHMHLRQGVARHVPLKC